MRARYTAFTRGNVDFIVASHHPETRDDVNRDEIERWSRDSQWLGLDIVASEHGGPDDDEGVVVFTARYRLQGQVHDHVERATFRRQDGEWRFHDADEPKADTIRRESPKVGRNDPCPCGSGVKHKKCCGRAA